MVCAQAPHEVDRDEDRGQDEHHAGRRGQAAAVVGEDATQAPSTFRCTVRRTARCGGVPNVTTDRATATQTGMAARTDSAGARPDRAPLGGSLVVTLPVPRLLPAEVIVPSTRALADPRSLILEQTAVRLGGLAGRLAQRLIGGDHDVTPIEVVDTSSLPPEGLLRAHGASESDLQQLYGAAQLLRITSWTPVSPPFAHWAVRAGGVALAEHLGTPLLDDLTLAPPARFRPTLADDELLWSPRGWFSVPMSTDTGGGWVTTRGLSRYGLPELETVAVPPDLVAPWSIITSGTAYLLFTRWTLGLREPPRPDTFDVGDELPVGLAALASLRGQPLPEKDTGVMIALSSHTDEEGNQHLRLGPPRSEGRPPGEWMAQVVEQLFGAQEDLGIAAAGDDVVRAAEARARASLPGIRARLLRGDLPLGGVVMVKYDLDVAGHREKAWLWVTDWRDPARVVGTAERDIPGADPPIPRGGRRTIGEADIVDWAVQTAEGGITEGYWTKAAVEGQTR